MLYLMLLSIVSEPWAHTHELALASMGPFGLSIPFNAGGLSLFSGYFGYI